MPEIRPGLPSDPNYHEGHLNSTSIFPYLSGPVIPSEVRGADRAVDATRARTVKIMYERMFENICMTKRIRVGVDAMRVGTKRLGCRGKSTSWPCHTGKTTLCAHQPVPWKRNECWAAWARNWWILPDGQRQTFRPERHCHLTHTALVAPLMNDLGPMINFFIVKRVSSIVRRQSWGQVNRSRGDSSATGAKPKLVPATINISNLISGNSWGRAWGLVAFHPATAAEDSTRAHAFIFNGGARYFDAGVMGKITIFVRLECNKASSASGKPLCATEGLAPDNFLVHWISEIVRQYASVHVDKFHVVTHKLAACKLMSEYH